MRRRKRRIFRRRGLTKICLTGDGSKTIYSERFGESYHSAHGATKEAMHVFIEAGYLAVEIAEVSVLEIGFGSGLNAWFTMLKAEELKRATRYETVELYPVDEIAAQEFSDDENFLALHASSWEEPVEMSPWFVLRKMKCDLLLTTFTQSYDLVYFDAFSPRTQPEMWTKEIFAKLFAVMTSGAVLVTYCAKGDVRRAMQDVGFEVERLKGPPAGKREMLRARKN